MLQAGWRPFKPDETPNDYWDHLVEEKAQLPYDLCSLALTRRAQGYSRYMPAYLMVPLVEFPGIIEAYAHIDVRSNEPEELARFVMRVRGRDDRQPTRITHTDWVPDVNDWNLLARFFHKSYIEGVRHEIGELFKFDGKRIFDPHLVTENDLSTLDGKTQYLHFDSIKRRQHIHDFVGGKVCSPYEGL